MATLCYAVRTLYKIMRDRKGRGQEVEEEVERGNLDCTRKCHIVTVWSIRLPPRVDALLARKCNSIPHWWVAVRMRWIDRSVDRCVTCSWLQQEEVKEEEKEERCTLPMVAKYAISPRCHRWPNSANWQYLWTRTRFCRRFNWIVVASPVDPSHPILSRLSPTAGQLFSSKLLTISAAAAAASQLQMKILANHGLPRRFGYTHSIPPGVS